MTFSRGDGRRQSPKSDDNPFVHPLARCTRVAGGRKGHQRLHFCWEEVEDGKSLLRTAAAQLPACCIKYRTLQDE